MDSLKLTYAITGIIVVLIAGFLYFSVYKKTDISPIGNNATTTVQVATTTIYKNTKYGFEITLPKTWEGFSVSTEDWEGDAVGSAEVIESGPLIFVRHPLWTEENERQDIPVMVFTLTQWDKMVNEDFYIGAGPVAPTELGKNKKYVFALPARYNFSYLTGFEEVDVIIRSDAFQAF